MKYLDKGCLVQQVGVIDRLMVVSLGIGLVASLVTTQLEACLVVFMASVEGLLIQGKAMVASQLEAFV